MFYPRPIGKILRFFFPKRIVELFFRQSINEFCNYFSTILSFFPHDQSTNFTFPTSSPPSTYRQISLFFAWSIDEITIFSYNRMTSFANRRTYNQRPINQRILQIIFRQISQNFPPRPIYKFYIPRLPPPPSTHRRISLLFFLRQLTKFTNFSCNGLMSFERKTTERARNDELEHKVVLKGPAGA